MKSILVAGALLVALAGPAFATQCPMLIQKAEAALQSSTLDDAGKAKVTEHIAKAKSEHDAGNHDAAEATMKDTMQLLGM